MKKLNYKLTIKILFSLILIQALLSIPGLAYNYAFDEIRESILEKTLGGEALECIEAARNKMEEDIQNGFNVSEIELSQEERKNNILITGSVILYFGILFSISAFLSRKIEFNKPLKKDGLPPAS